MYFCGTYKKQIDSAIYLKGDESMGSFISKDAFKSLYSSDPIYIFDTNVYLNLLRYSKKTSQELLLIYRLIQGNISVLPQVNREFKKNLSIVEKQRFTNAKKSVTEIKNAINSCNGAITKQLQFFIKYKFGGSQEIFSKSISDLETLKKSLEQYGENCIKQENDGFMDKKEIEDFFLMICVHSELEGFSPSTLFDIYKDGDIRYKYKIPPGYMDDPRNNPKSSKDGVDIFGDLVMWYEIIDFGKKKGKPIIFVTADTKEDWFSGKEDHATSPREELIKEYEERSNGNQICILTDNKFVEYMGEILQVNTVISLAEMQKDDYADIAVRNNQEVIKQKILEWINIPEHICLIPFVEEINRITEINNLTLVVKTVSADVQTNIQYMVSVEGTAEIVGSYLDENIGRVILSDIRDEFHFSSNLSFHRSFITGDPNGEIFGKDISNIEIKSGVFERCILEEISLESKRGIFIKPNEDDYQVYNYMMKNWDKYENKNSVNRAEALMFIDAAKFFSNSLLEINRSFTLVQNQSTKTNLSLNEIDALALKRLKDIGFVIDGNNCSFDGELIPLGDAYPLPKTMEILPPQAGKELDVYFECEVNNKDNKYIQIIGTTNLPINTYLMIGLINRQIKYRASSKVQVLENGKFQSEVFKYGNDVASNAIPDGEYEIEIIVPIASVQSDNVKVALGQKGRNLIGSLVTCDDVTGKTIKFTKIIQINL